MTHSPSAPFAPDEDMLRRVLADQWGIRAENVLLLQQRDGQSVYEVRGEDTFILKVYPAGTDPERLHRNAAVMAHLNALHFPAPLVHPDLEGRTFYGLPGYLLLLQTKVPGTMPAANHTSMALLGTLAARLHGLPLPPVASSIDPVRLSASMHDLGLRYQLPAEYFEQLAALPDFSRLPAALIHTDLELRNMVTTADGNGSLIDWDDAGTGIALLDVVYPLVPLLQEDGRFDEALYRSFYEAYNRIRPLDAGERQLFADAVFFWLLLYSVIPGTGIIRRNLDRAQGWQRRRLQGLSFLS